MYDLNPLRRKSPFSRNSLFSIYKCAAFYNFYFDSIDHNLEIWYHELFPSSYISHLKDNHLQPGHEVETSVSSEINRIKITDLFSDLRERILQGFFTKLDFRKTINMCDEDYYNLTGLLCDQFEDLVSCRSSSTTSAVRSTREVTGLLITKLPSAMYHSIPATFNWDTSFSDCCFG